MLSSTAVVARQVCRARGMRAPFGEGAMAFMRKQLKEWLDLSLNRCVLPVPVCLSLLLSMLGMKHAFHDCLTSLSEPFSQCCIMRTSGRC